MTMGQSGIAVSVFACCHNYPVISELCVLAGLAGPWLLVTDLTVLSTYCTLHLSSSHTTAHTPLAHCPARGGEGEGVSNLFIIINENKWI